ncbi:Rv3235 family protein [Arthrobacter castelli]|uniref:Rv3235 family protein n=1 Tax=Arthrobacter castelli TaxID=271431 RepID=UPI000415C899|nr:Rv3235 family protein [Arthrobacter castelli]
MKAETAAQHDHTARRLTTVPAPDQAGEPGQPEASEPPELTATRSGHLFDRQGYAPVIRLTPRTGHKDRAEDSAGNRPTADIVDIESAEVRRRVLGISRSIAQASLEVLAGTRPATQLSRWLDPVSYEKLQFRAKILRGQRERRRAATASRIDQLHRNPRVRSVRLCRISRNAYEAALIVIEQDRVRAVALRLEYRRELWKVTALEIG